MRKKNGSEQAGAAQAPTIPVIDTTIPDLLQGRAGGDKKDISQRVLDLNKQLIAAEDAQQERIAATLTLMIEKQQIAESNIGTNQKELRLLEANQTFRQSIQAIDKNIADQRVEDLAKAAQGFEAQMAHQDELRQAIAEQKGAYDELNTTFRNGIVDSILAAVEGTKSLSDSLLGVIKSMAKMILQQQLLNALQGFNLFGGGGGSFFNSPQLATSGMVFCKWWTTSCWSSINCWRTRP